MTSRLFEVRDLGVTFPISRGVFSHSGFRALENVNFVLDKGRSLGIVGESGSGKSTLSLTLLKLLQPTRGEIRFKGKPLDSISRRDFSRVVLPVFQDPYSSLNPYRRIDDIVAEPLYIHGERDKAMLRSRAAEVLETVGLPLSMASRLPEQLSGGQRQRVALARAIIGKPEVLICDEVTSALDVSVQAQVLELLGRLQKEMNLSLIFISHNLAVVERLVDDLLVLQSGKTVEQGEAASIFRSPQSAYTKTLISSVLSPFPAQT